MKEETTITFFASECGEFHGMGECIECTSLKDTLQELRQETAPRQLGKEEKQKAAIR